MLQLKFNFDTPSSIILTTLCFSVLTLCRWCHCKINRHSSPSAIIASAFNLKMNKHAINFFWIRICFFLSYTYTNRKRILFWRYCDCHCHYHCRRWNTAKILIGTHTESVYYCLDLCEYYTINLPKSIGTRLRMEWKRWLCKRMSLKNTFVANK